MKTKRERALEARYPVVYRNPFKIGDIVSFIEKPEHNVNYVSYVEGVYVSVSQTPPVNWGTRRQAYAMWNSNSFKSIRTLLVERKGEEDYDWTLQ